MASTVRFERRPEVAGALREAVLRGSWLDVRAWEACRRAGRRRFVRTIALFAWLLPALVLMMRARCLFMPDLECGGWVDAHWGLLLLGALVWAGVSHAAAELEWWLCEEKYLYEMARPTGSATEGGTPGERSGAGQG